MKNPCEECLVRPICTTVCKPLIAFSVEVLKDKGLYKISTWMSKYEVRPRIKKAYK
jgi:hypothetical protein